MDIQPAPTGEQISYWATKAKKAGKATMIGGSIGVNIAQLATGTGTIALATAAAAASATGIGLVVAAGALTLGQSGLAIRSAYKTRQHLSNLNKTLERSNAYACGPVEPGGEVNRYHHMMVAKTVLPYIISKKANKFTRKVATAIPGISVLETSRAVGKKFYKKLRGTLGEGRKDAATWLAIHLITHNCALSQAIVADLYSFEEMLWLQTLKSKELVPYLAEKMKST